ncbi:MAG TPA: ABC transporter ATP-binding protein [Gammaproteobacteria bacterium]|jgi:ATP-binding cassette subfamily B protein|nr:ABC transporter ATP-binding protein [Gammaproteobacteria bacterium]
MSVEKSSNKYKKQVLSFRHVLQFAAGYWRQQPKKLGLVLLLVLTAALVETYLPSALASFLKAVQTNESHQAILQCLGVFLGAYFTQCILFSISYLMYNTFETKLFKSLIDDAFVHVCSLPEKFFSNTFAGSIISKINRARQKIETFEDQVLMRILPTIAILVGSIFFLSLQFPVLAIIIVVYLVLLVAVISFLVFRVSGPAQGIYAEEQDHFNAHLADNIAGVTATKSYAQEQYEISRFFRLTEKLRIKNLHAYLLSNFAGFIQSLLLAGMLVILMGGGTWYFFHGMASVENMAYLAFAYTIMQSYIREVGENIKNLLTSSYDLHGVMMLLREESEVQADHVLPELQITKGEIVIDHVGFSYPGKSKPIFKGLTTKIHAGERIALVGHSGGGKTSFIRLLQRLYTMQEGRILVDGQDINCYSPDSLRRAIALVPQDPVLFHRSLRENIAYAKPGATDAEIHEAAEKAHIAHFISGLPEQYETLVGERGVKLSGGERQRIAIARAILADRPILILDEATSSLDSESEHAIQDALHQLTHGRTSIIIAHRLSTILDADRILVFESGAIVEEGSHEALIKRENGIYANLFKLQSGGFIAE